MSLWLLNKLRGVGISAYLGDTKPDFPNGFKLGAADYTKDELNTALGGGDTSATVTGITAGTTQTQGGATALTGRVNVVSTVGTTDDGVKLPTAVVGLRVLVLNAGANALKLYPATGAAINGLSANAAIVVPAGHGVEVVATSATAWRALPRMVCGQVTLDGSNPTAVTLPLTSVVAAGVSMDGSAAPGDDPSYVTSNVSGTTLNVYAWKNTGGTDPTLVASTDNARVINWWAFGY